jgi:hypothetical protein
MVNPWLALPTTSPHVLPEDRAQINAYNAKLPETSLHRIQVDELIPEPFIGAVATAPVIVLQLNPGNAENNVASHAQPDFRRALFANLRHEPTEWPFYFFDPRFREHPGGLWWISKTTELLAEKGQFERLAHKLAVIEWFPYKSSRFRGNCSVPSQQYGFSLVGSAMARGALVIVSRSVALWEKSVPALQGYERKLTLSSVQNVVLSRNNVKFNGVRSARAWEMLREALA